MAREDAVAGDIREGEQTALSATTLTDVHTAVNGGSKAVVVRICNRSTATTFRLSVAKKGATDATSQYLFYDAPLAANATVEEIITGLNATDVIRAYAGSANVTVTVNGLFV